MIRLRPLAVAAAGLLAACITPACAQVRRCTAADGSVIYTDQRCDVIGATERLPPNRGSAATGATALYRRGCAQNLDDLIYELTYAIDSRDVNRIAGVYHWTGMGTRAAYDVMRKLDALSRRSLMDVVPLYPQVAEAQGSFGEDGAFYPAPSKPRPPIGLQVIQGVGREGTMRTIFGLRRNLGCLWISY